MDRRRAELAAAAFPSLGHHGHDFLMRNCPSLIDGLHRLKRQLVTQMLVRQPLGQGLAHDPALAPLDALGDLVQTRNELLGKVGSHDTP